MSKDYTINELREFLRARSLPVSGSKSDLILRLEEFDPDIWNLIAVSRESAGQGELPRRDVEEEEEVVQPSRDRGIRENELQARELELMRLERDLLQREVELLRRERASSNNPLTGSPGISEMTNRSSSSANVGIRAIGDLLCEFDARDSTFWKWEQQVRLLRISYELDDRATRVLISSKLKGRAANWFHSKSEHLTMDIETLLREMKLMFDHRPSKLTLRKEFENRGWNTGEHFSEYYHDKVILGNRVPIAGDEMIDYLIDGIPDTRLRDHARISRFQTTADLLEAFDKVTLDAKRVVASEKKPIKGSSDPKEKQELPKKMLRCFNCGETGHVAPRCSKPKSREFGSCFGCGSTTHQWKDCPRRTGNKRGETNARKEPSATTSTNVVQPALPAPYLLSLSYGIVDKNNHCCKYTLCAMLDSGSPISFIKNSFVPVEARTPLPENSIEFAGINGSRMEVLSLFEREVEIEGISIKLIFHVVPDNTMAFMAILGRDFSSNSLVKISFDNGLIVTRREKESAGDLSLAVAQILNIDCVGEPVTASEKLQINPEIGPALIDRIKELYQSDYLQVKESSTDNIDFEMKITLKHDQPISFRPRRLSYADKGKLQSILDDLLGRKIIRPSESPYSSPIVLVRKKSGETRLCIDYRELNKITIKDNFPSQLIDDNIDRLKNKQYFTTLDLKDGYYNVRMADQSIKFTSFVTPLGQYEFLFCPFGLTNAPKVFARFVQKIFCDLIRAEKVLVYFDDFLIATETLDQHLGILQEVFQRAGRYQLTFKLNKCAFVQSEVNYLGYRVSFEGIRPSNENIEAVLRYPIPRNSKDVLRFVSLASYFRRFIPGFSIVAKPLYDLVRREVKFIFGEKENEAFEMLKRHLAGKPILSIYSPTAETEVHCDASASGFGAILLQRQVDRYLRPIAYYSQRTTPTEAKYHSFELECLAVVNAVKRFRIYLEGIHFRILTDCDSFRLTLSKQNVNPRISRWALYLQDFDYEIQHRPGKRMNHVDALSRCHSILVVEGNTFEQTLSICQDRDSEIKEIRDRLEKTELKHYELRNGLVYRKDKNKKLFFYVPRSMEDNVIRTCHDDLAHAGQDKVVSNITKLYWFPNLREKVREYISNCLRCIEFSPHDGKQEGYLHSIEKGKVPFHTLHIDHLGPLEKTGRGYRHVLTIIDGFTKFIKLFPCKSTGSQEAIKFLGEYFRAYSRPRRVITDRGTAFTSNAFEEFLGKENVQHILIAVGTPRANGQIERFNRVITPMIAKLCEAPNKWDRVLEQVEFALNNTDCRATKESPSRLLFGVEQLGKLNDCLRLLLDSVSTENRDLEAIREKAANNIGKIQAANEKQYNSKRKDALVYNVGDYVMIKNVDTSAGINKKLLPKFKGPYVVEKVLDCDRYVVGDIDGFQVTQLPYHGVLSPDNMKPYIVV